MATTATFTKRIGQSRKTFVVWIPKDVATLLSLRKKNIVEVHIRVLQGDVAS